MNNYIISVDVATDNPTVIITSIPYGHKWRNILRARLRKHKIRKIFSMEMIEYWKNI